MTRICAGLYQGVFLQRTYKVWRDRFICGAKMISGWRYQVDGGMWSLLYDSKALANAAACREITRATK